MQFLTEQLRNWPFFLLGPFPAGPLGGLAANVLVTAFCMTAALIVGTILGLGRLSRRRCLRWPCTGVVEVLRSVPALLLVFWCAVFLPSAFGVNISLIAGAIVGLSLHAASYQAEIVRAGILAVPSGQYDAAVASGMTRIQAVRFVVMPQAFRAMIPTMGAFLISLFKDTSLIYIIGVVDLTQAAVIVSQRQPDRMTAAYVCMALGFFLVCRLLASATRQLERRFPVAGGMP